MPLYGLDVSIKLYCIVLFRVLSKWKDERVGFCRYGDTMSVVCDYLNFCYARICKVVDT